MNVSKPPVYYNYLTSNIILNTWESVESFFEELKSRTINSVQDLQKWLSDKSELETFIQEDCGWRYIKMTCETSNEKYTEAFNYFVQEIEPRIAPYTNAFNIKFIECEFTKQLNKSTYGLLLKQVELSIKLFREENIALQAEMQTLQNEYGALVAQMMITHDGNDLTLPQAAKFFKSKNRELREQIYVQICTRRLKDKKKLNDLLNKLIALRHQIALNAGYNNFTNYKYDELHRFDYNQSHVETLHASVSKHIKPIIQSFQQERKNILTTDSLRPWDMDVDLTDKELATPFATDKELLKKTVSCFNEIDPFFAACINTMQIKGYLDLDSRKGKSPGGYNYPLYESNIPFIFMNAAGTMRDVETMVHEGGHAIHSFLSGSLPLIDFKNLPSEVAELASMSMELMAMEHFHHFNSDENELKQIKKHQLQSSLETLVWVCTVDKFQHWIYNNPKHTIEEREQAWLNIYDEFNPNCLDFSNSSSNIDLMEMKKNMWQKQLHIYEVPFYYIEYAIAQLGAIAMWRQYKLDGKTAIANYKNALKLGYSVTIPSIYKTAGIEFDFSENYIVELANFIKTELVNLN